MDWTRSIDGYCERVGPAYWAEPINAVTNAAFLIAAVIMWRRTRGAGLPLADALVVILAGIGLASFLFHTHAQVWAALADTGAIAVFAVTYVFAAHRDYWGLKGRWAWAATALFIPYVVVTVPIFARVPFFEISSAYWPLPLLMLVYGVALRRRAPTTGHGLLIAAGICSVSLTARSLDMPMCDALPFGTHFLWHILNGVLLGWMIEVYLRHMRGTTTDAAPT